MIGRNEQRTDIVVTVAVPGLAVSSVWAAAMLSIMKSLMFFEG